MYVSPSATDCLDPAARQRIGRVLALGTLAGGTIAVTTSFLYATGRHREAAALGIATGIVGTVLGALEVLSLYSVTSAPAAEQNHPLLSHPPPSQLAAATVAARQPMLSGVFGRPGSRSAVR